MRLNQLLLLLYMLFLLSCKNENFNYYSEIYNKNKNDYVSAKNNLYKLLEKAKGELFKYEIEFTGKMFNEYSYSTDNTKIYVDSIRLSEFERSFCQHFMYKQNLNFIVVYQDSAIFYYRRVFKGTSQVIIYEDGIECRWENAIKIDNNTYYRFIEN